MIKIKKNKVVIYVRNSELTPSSYYRIIQYAKNLKGNVKIRSLMPNKMYKKSISMNKKSTLYMVYRIIFYLTIITRAFIYLTYDNLFKPEVMIVSKYLIPQYMPLIIRYLLENLVTQKRLLWDFDDYILKESGELTKQDIILGNNSDAIIVTSDYLKNQLPVDWQTKVTLLPTTDGDLQGFNKDELILNRMRTFNNQIRIVWVGTKSSLNYLENKVKILDYTAGKLEERVGKKVILAVVCNEKLKISTKNLVIENINWTREIAQKEIYKAHIGIMPLDYSKFSLGKGGFKLVQYISTALPVIASDIGFNNKVVDDKSGILVNDLESDEGWCEAVFSIVENEEKWKEYSHNAYENWKVNFSYSRNLDVWNSLIVNSKKRE